MRYLLTRLIRWTTGYLLRRLIVCATRHVLTRFNAVRTLRALIAGLALLCIGTAAHAADALAEDRAVFLIAAPSITHPTFRHAVLLVSPLANDSHVGVIINRPSNRTLASLFPDDLPSRKVIDPVYFGGPMSADTLFALVRADQSPGPDSIELMTHVYLAQRREVVDRLIQTTPNEARYYAGTARWKPGQLRMEIGRGLWLVGNPDLATVFGHPTNRLWRDLLEQAAKINARNDHPDHFSGHDLLEAHRATMQMNFDRVLRAEFSLQQRLR